MKFAPLSAIHLILQFIEFPASQLPASQKILKQNASQNSEQQNRRGRGYHCECHEQFRAICQLAHGHSYAYRQRSRARIGR